MNRILRNADLDAAIKAWNHLHARGLASPLVCKTLFGAWSLCACHRCDTLGGV